MPRPPSDVLLVALAMLRGSSVQATAGALHLNPASFRSTLTRYGVHPRRRRRPVLPPCRRRRTGVTDPAAAWALYQTRTIRATAALVGVSPACLRRAFRAAGYETRGKEATWAMKRRVGGPTLGRIGVQGAAWAWAYYQRHSLAETAAYCGISPSYLRTLFREAGHPIRSGIETMRLLARGPFTRELVA